MSEPRILYLTGWMRSGSTMLGNVLGELPGVLHVGELHYLWRNGGLRQGTNSLCGCGQNLADCDLWSCVFNADRTAHTATAMTSAQQALLRTRHTAARLGELRSRSSAPGLEDTVKRTVAVYRMLTQLGGGRLIVDGSKYPAEAAALLRRTDLDVRVLHIVRDPRATAFSYKHAKDYIDPMSPARSSAYWTAFNVASEAVGRAAGPRYLRLRYEDLCRRPQAKVAEVMRFAGLDDEPPVDQWGRVCLGENHTVTGNPDRLHRGEVVIRGDERWRSGLDPAEVLAASVPALPLLARYGYRLSPAAA